MTDTKNESMLATMRGACYATPFGPMLYNELTPTDLASFMYAFYLSLTKKQTLRYMLLWRTFFMSRKWLDHMEELGYKIAFFGVDLPIPIARARFPNLNMVTPEVLRVGMFAYTDECLREESDEIDKLSYLENDMMSEIFSTDLINSETMPGTEITFMPTLKDKDRGLIVPSTTDKAENTLVVLRMLRIVCSPKCARTHANTYRHISMHVNRSVAPMMQECTYTPAGGDLRVPVYQGLFMELSSNDHMYGCMLNGITEDVPSIMSLQNERGPMANVLQYRFDGDRTDMFRRRFEDMVRQKTTVEAPGSS